MAAWCRWYYGVVSAGDPGWRQRQDWSIAMLEPAGRSGIRIRIGRAGVIVFEIGLLGGVAVYEPADAIVRDGLEARPAETATTVLRGSGPVPTPAAEPAPAAGAASATAAGPSLVAVPSITVSIPGAAVVYFSVSGESSRAIGESVRQQSGSYCSAIAYPWYTGDTRPLGCADYAVGYQSLTSAGACRTTGFWLDQTVYFPQWATPLQVPAPLLAWWRDWLVVLASHEAGHVAIAQDWLPKIQAQGLGLDCSGVDATIRTPMQQLATAQAVYDKYRYATETYPAPPD
jgi:predicted secreted Zn-dependent protease